MCSAAARASHTFTSGKLNEFIDLFVGKVDVAAGCGNQRWIQVQTVCRPCWFGVLYGVGNTSQDQLTSGTSLARRKLVQPAMDITRKIDAGADGTRLHTNILSDRDLNKSIVTFSRV